MTRRSGSLLCACLLALLFASCHEPAADGTDGAADGAPAAPGRVEGRSSGRAPVAAAAEEREEPEELEASEEAAEAAHRAEGPEMTKIEDARTEVGGAPVHTLAAGPEEAPAVLLLHGARFSAQTWRDLGTLEVLAGAGLRAIAVDLPGHGESPASKLSSDGFLVALLDALGLERAIVVAPSMSGAYAFPLVLAHPDRLAGFVAVAPASIPDDPAALAAIATPTLVVWGSEDQVFPVARGRALAAAIAGSELFVIEGGAHPCYLDDPEGFHARLVAFARGASGR